MRMRVDLFECSVRVRGTPGERQGFPFGLDADREAFDVQTVPPTPAVVARARRDLTGIILTEKVVYPNGRPNPRGH
jgi:hypothetical protein